VNSLLTPMSLPDGCDKYTGLESVMFASFFTREKFCSIHISDDSKHCSPQEKPCSTDVVYKARMKLDLRWLGDEINSENYFIRYFSYF
jgi:hypothetical protein